MSRATGQGEPRAGGGKGCLPGIVVEDTRRIAQEPASKLRPLSSGNRGRAFMVGARHDTGAGNAYLSVMRELPAGHAPLRKARGLGGKRQRRGEAGRGRAPSAASVLEGLALRRVRRALSWGGALWGRGAPAESRTGVVVPGGGADGRACRQERARCFT